MLDTVHEVKTLQTNTEELFSQIKGGFASFVSLIKAGIGSIMSYIFILKWLKINYTFVV